MIETKPTAELMRLRQWAREKIDAGSEPPWAWYQYMKLIESIEAILAGMSVTTTENSRQSEEHPGKRLRLVDSTSPRDDARHHPYKPKIQLPM